MGSGDSKGIYHSDDCLEMNDNHMALKCLNGFSLKQMKSDHQPSKFENKKLNKKFQEIVEIIQFVLKPHQIVKSGSFGRGTNIKVNYDIDVVVIMSCHKFMQNLERENKFHIDKSAKNLLYKQHPQITIWRNVLEDKLIQNFPSDQVKSIGTHMINFTTYHNDIKFDIMIVPQLPYTTIINAMKDYRLDPSNEICRMLSAALTPSRLKPYKTAPANAKTMIRVVKYWSKNCTWSSHFREPISFVLETIMLTIWYENKNLTDFQLLIKFFEAILDCCNRKRNFYDLGTNFKLYPLRDMSRTDELIKHATAALCEIRQKYSINL
jgi:hypothetical protein